MKIKRTITIILALATVLVFAAGNEGRTSPHSYTVAPLVSLDEEITDLKTIYANSIYKNLLISVVAVDENKKITDYSNRCGVGSMYCLSAPGGSKTALMGSTSIGEGYALAAGTSQAAPVVTGAVAVLMGAFPFLKPQQVVQILFDTATPINPESSEIETYNIMAWKEEHGGVDPTPETEIPDVYSEFTTDKYNAIYGHGLVNLEKATDPIGLPQISFDTVASSPLSVNASSTTVTVPTSLAHVLSVLPKNIVVLDKYTRPYAMSTSRFVNTEKRTDALKRSFQSFMASNEKVINMKNLRIVKTVDFFP